MSGNLSKDDLWQLAADLPVEDVPLVHPVTKKSMGTVRMRGLTGEELERYQQAVSSGNGKQVTFKGAVARLIQLSAINEDGSRYFEPSDRMKISQSPSWMLMQLFETAGKLSGVSEDDVNEMIEDFDDAQSSDAGTD